LFPLLRIDVTTKKSEFDPHVEQRQLEVALEHANAAGQAAAPRSLSEGLDASEESFAFVEARYPSYRFREALRSLRLDVGSDGRWIVLTLEERWGKEVQEKAAKAACAVLRHYYPDEEFSLYCPTNETAVIA
jgi:hypothetical protein